MSETPRDETRDAEREDPAIAEAGAPRSALATLVSWLMPALLAMVVILPLRSAVADWNDVPSGSMWPTILEGDRIFVDKLAYGLRLPFTTVWLHRWDEPARGDVVTFASPRDGTRLVKRIVAVPGDRIAMRDNRLVLNGEPLAYADTEANTEDAGPRTLENGRALPMQVATEPLPGRSHDVAFTLGLVGRDHFEEIVVPAGHYFFLGDNRDQSYDSRFLGLAAEDQIYGRVTHVALSVDPSRGYRPRFDRWFTRLD